MKRISILILLISVSMSAMSQSYRKTNMTSTLHKVVYGSELDHTFYNPNLLHLDQHPVPYYSDYGNLKQRAQQKRATAIMERKNNVTLNKTLGVAANPIIDTAWKANAGGIPLDNDIAVSNNGTIISAVNSNFFIYDENGNQIGIMAIASMVPFLGVNDRISDPRLLYDPKTDRFIVVCFKGNLSTTSTIIIGFTATNDPLGNWNFYGLTGNPFNDSTWSDYPIISISDKDLFMTFNQIQEGVSWQTGFRQSVIYQIKKDDGYNAATALSYTLWDSIKYNNTLYRNICPAKYQETNMGDDMYFLSVRNVDTANDSIFVMHIDNSYQSGQASMTQKVVKSPVTYGFPPNPKMNNGNYLMTNDGRVLAAIYENDYIHFGANSIHPTLSNAGVLLGEIKNVSSTTPTVNTKIFSDANIEYGYPSMCYMGTSTSDHRVLFNLAHCYTDSFPGISVVYKDNNGDFSDIISAKDGGGAIDRLIDTNERWGDYSGIQTRYNNPNEAYLAGTIGTGTSTRAWVAKIKNAEWALNVNEQENIIPHKLFPNPVKESKFTSRFTLAKKENLKFNLYDLEGRLIKTLMQADCKIGQNEFSFNTGVLSPGNYVFTILGENRKVLSELITVK